ncbi:N-acetylmuramoyl-L-alanine amidase family protein [Serpentinicella alkaliphila]|uniref:N-acetylmuramoyl-L-alanine amidase n=1 Tax=Serpentinicella alkaliphila TaxID=1734049 RepID=A0A4R2SXT7_9FIRM|nr:N-acetylmuramoyl-L-alanine amidase [Serpentinicella alkaliphila]QUH25846.1 N-acetylmuramoyl-L-alanine amidase [Serpentinicella alkaliphila]TCP95307.1 N-acetylmuramoyl-L-alanine amidase [Serpentinicella alkaliphila]
MILLISKNKLVLFLCMFIIIISINLLKFTAIRDVMKMNNETLWGKIIVIDPGHGGIDGGTCHGNDILEKNINLSISLKLKKELQKRGATVVMTRETDDSLDDHINNGNRHAEDLRERVRIINNSNADLFISIHVNYTKNIKRQGPIVFYYLYSEKSKVLAENVQTHLNGLSAYKEIGLNRRPVEGSYYILKNTLPPGVIIETGFISNEVDRELLLEEKHQKEITILIKNSIVEYFDK